MGDPYQIFIAYSHKDAAHLDQLRAHLTPLERTGKAIVWYDGEIDAGEEWDDAIQQNLDAADIILLLVSADAIASDYFYGREVARALERHQRGEAHVAPLIVRPCRWTETPLGELQALPKGGKAVSLWTNQDAAFDDAVGSLLSLMDELDAFRQEMEKHKAEEEMNRREKEVEPKPFEEEDKKSNKEPEEGVPPDDGSFGEIMRWKKRRKQRRAIFLLRLPSLKWGGAAGLVVLLVWMIPQIKGLLDQPDTPEEAGQPSFPEPEMVFIPGGTFQMGSTEGEKDERPVHSITVSDFFLGKYEVTNAEFVRFLREEGNQMEGGVTWIRIDPDAEDRCRIEKKGDTFEVETGYENYPVTFVSWYGARAYSDWISRKTGRKYRFPTEAEWEYAAGNGSRHTRFSWGDGPPSGKKGGNISVDMTKKKTPDWSFFEGYDDGFPQTAPVGQFDPNDFGLFDMTGNVWEWCSDWYGNFPDAPQHDPEGPGSGMYRILRGGSWEVTGYFCRNSKRSMDYPGLRAGTVGFRLAHNKTLPGR